MAQTAALLKPSQKVLDAIKAYTVKIDGETISDYPLKATLIFEAMQRYGVTAAVLAETLGKPLEVVNAYLDQRINPAQTGTDPYRGNRPYREIDRAKVERQLKAEKAALGITYTGSIPDAEITRDMSVLLASRGIDDIQNIAPKSYILTIQPGERLTTDAAGAYLYFYGDQSFPVPAEKVRVTDEYDSSNETWVKTAYLAQPLDVDLGTQYIYNKTTGQQISEQDYGVQSGRMQWGANYSGKGGTIYYVEFLPTGLPVFTSQWVSTSDLGTVVMIVGFVSAIFGVPALLGENILAAVGLEASSAVTTAVGNVAINTALTGGDVTAAVSKAAASFAGGAFGGEIGEIADSAAIGKAAAVATTAALQGKQADAFSIAAALVNSDETTGTKMDETIDYSNVDPFDPATGYVYDPNAVLPDVAYEGFTFEDIGLDTSTAVDIADSLDVGEVAIEGYFGVDDLGNMYDDQGALAAMTEDAYIASLYPDADGIKDGYNNVVIPAAQVQGMTDEEIAQELQRYMAKQSGAEIASSERTENTPAANPEVAKSVKMPTLTEQAGKFDKLLKTAVSIGASVKAIASGTFRASYPTSMYGTPRAAVGVPVQRADGSVVTNNGNGTQTIRYPDGRVQTVSSNYTGSGVFGGMFGGINTQTLLIGGAVLLGAVLLTRRR